MNKWIDIIVASLTVISLVIVLIDYILTLSTIQKLAIYLFDLVVVILLAWDFSLRVKDSSNRGSYILRHWYELSSHCSGTINAGDNKNCNIDIIVNKSSR